MKAKHCFQLFETRTRTGRECQSWSVGQDVIAEEDERKEVKADLGSGDLAKTQSINFPRKGTHPKSPSEL